MPKQSPAKSEGASTIALLAVIAGFALGFLIRGAISTPKSGESDAYRRGYDDARAKVTASGIIPAEAPAYELRGIVAGTSAEWIDVDVPSLTSSPFENPTPAVRRVRITAATRIVKLTQKSQEEFQAEVDAYESAMAKDGIPTSPSPVLVTESEVTASALAAGQAVTVKASEDVRSAAEFNATEIRIQPPVPGMPSMPVPPPDAPPIQP